MKSYSYDIDIKISGCGQEARSKKDAKKRIIENFYEETGMTLTEEEISNVEEEHGKETK